MKKIIFYLVFLVSNLILTTSNSFSSDWVVKDTVHYWDKIQCLSDSSVWLDCDGNGIYEYKYDKFRQFYEFWHSVDQHFYLNYFNKIVDNYLNCKWLFNHSIYKFQNYYDTLEFSNPNMNTILDAVYFQNYIWWVSGDTSGITRFDGTNVINLHIQDSAVSQENIGFREIRLDNYGNFWLVNNYGL